MQVSTGWTDSIAYEAPFLSFSKTGIQAYLKAKFLYGGLQSIVCLFFIFLYVQSPSRPELRAPECRVHAVHLIWLKPWNLRKDDILKNSQYVPPHLAIKMKVMLFLLTIHLYYHDIWVTWVKTEAFLKVLYRIFRCPCPRYVNAEHLSY